MGEFSPRSRVLTSVVADTQSAVWFLIRRKRLSAPAVSALMEAESRGDSIIISAISLVELTYIIEKNRLPRTVLMDLRSRCYSSDSAFRVAPVDYPVTLALERIPRDQVPDMPDRIIGATALALDLKLVTSDKDLRDSLVSTIW